MAERLDLNELVSFKKTVNSNSAQLDAMEMLLIEKDLITGNEYFTKLKQVENRKEEREILKSSFKLNRFRISLLNPSPENLGQRIPPVCC
jgi:hypothetical protein